VLGNENPEASLPGEIIPFNEFYDYQDKYLDGKTSFGIPAELPPEIVEEVQRISVDAFKSIDGSGMARVDFFLQERTQKIFLNEINTIPGFTEISMYPKLWEVSGLPYSQLLEELVSLGLERHNKRKKSELKFSP
jgi:D-alanine-D-alanine ligase